jgi:ATP-binding protein involved in chromosome partitioning
VRVLDPRLAVIPERLKGVSRVVVFCSGKGGVGKTLLSSLAALIAARRGASVGLLDLDFNGPSSHVVLGASLAVPKEEKGLVPPEVFGVKLMSLALFAGEAPLPLRGADATDALLELLAVTRWGDLDLLVVDAPPGTGDELLDTVRFLKRGEAVVVTTPSRLSLSVVARLVRLLKDVGTTVLGLIENMGGGNVKEVAAEWGVRYLGWIPYDPAVEEALGDPVRLLDTEVAAKLEKALQAAGLLR